MSMAKTYWRCTRCGEIERPTNDFPDVIGKWCCPACDAYPGIWDQVEVLPAAELASLRAIKARLEDEPLTIAPIDAAVWECRQGVADAIDAYRRAVLGKE
jgi:hypothetical protein